MAKAQSVTPAAGSGCVTMPRTVLAKRAVMDHPAGVRPAGIGTTKRSSSPNPMHRASGPSFTSDLCVSSCTMGAASVAPVATLPLLRRRTQARPAALRPEARLRTPATEAIPRPPQREARGDSAAPAEPAGPVACKAPRKATGSEAVPALRHGGSSPRPSPRVTSAAPGIGVNAPCVPPGATHAGGFSSEPAPLRRATTMAEAAPASAAQRLLQLRSRD
mmetsp:Transcript_47721/g.103847  ORF Transcript_47721/g.103847 Transcript_47721/m.103847 type:complete len:219 (-) Transcript_47721:60-716(-)